MTNIDWLLKIVVQSYYNKIHKFKNKTLNKLAQHQRGVNVKVFYGYEIGRKVPGRKSFKEKVLREKFQAVINAVPAT